MNKEDKRVTRLLAPGPAGIAEAAGILRAGGLVALPTETVYGLGGLATDPRAVAEIYRAKDRPSFNPLIAHVADVAAARREGVFDVRAEKLAEAFWPGPLTLVLPLAPGATVCDLARAGLDSIALRIPGNVLTRSVIAAAGGPVAAPSANLSGHVSPATAAHVLADLDGRIDAVVSGGACPVGVESTIVSLLDETPRLLRPGGVPRAEIERVLGESLAGAVEDEAGQPVAPGLLASHYAPRASVRLEAETLREGEIGLDFCGRFADAPGRALDLSPSGDLTEAAANLFSMLRALDASGAREIAVAPIPEEDLGEAINDRLRRAAAPRG
ncbi:threonylcarbamoyl-AMP synthase [Rhodoblastus acidophilus]|uniref:Threonylcarbamoyl-AMP synthase n=1 Tax=Candidatus Rhodoblastus alkanivorans TaxID=2954117 RepID=A0ABS9Z4H9_9HYPH|nr:L-threonylcarbamoyladenylate synthase [Candidatus Rhodoblastus alkanivorans]MCI4677680.1 threonylcarbamoyl-AMP synthase [Candidatus Rhodoblastus alkanivorans]MCI4682588.1 threonylcarbamoyl-AMP synthase [Candidatus Rhodoblastus alkanivorans]MDI4639894.1 threonylcarbamoyl-AMP synthase [Rhodoblastus acidophilus]